ncbi:hypothetical protein BJX96DRAFT_138697 [Aspergillus floccosus]
MGEIYQNSYLTIAAAASSQSAEGCFSESIADRFILVQEPNQSSICIGVRDRQQTGKLHIRKAREPTMHGHTPLFTRAWAYQERMLSRRILFCSKFELQVGCRAGLWCECGQIKIAPHFFPPPQSPNLVEFKRLLEARPPGNSRGFGDSDFVAAVYHTWTEILERYVKLQVTKPADRLPALSAVAKAISQMIGGGYLAGIWRSSLMEGLL